MRAARDLARGSVRGRALALLSGTPGLELHTRELVRRLGATPRPVHLALESLQREGLVRSRRVGGLRLWSISQSHPLYEPIRQIAQRTLGVPAQLRARLEASPGVEIAFIFGSFATGSADAESDIDVFALGTPDWRAIARTTRDLGATFGREVNLLAWTRDELRRALKDGSPLLESLRREPKIWLIGDESEFERAIGALEEELRDGRAGGEARPGGRRSKAASRGKEPRASAAKSRIRSR